jgi:hypothetical protein
MVLVEGLAHLRPSFLGGSSTRDLRHRWCFFSLALVSPINAMKQITAKAAVALYWTFIIFILEKYEWSFKLCDFSKKNEANER